MARRRLDDGRPRRRTATRGGSWSATSCTCIRPATSPCSPNWSRRGEFGNGSEGLFAYGKRIVTERFGEVNLLFALDLLIRGVVARVQPDAQLRAGLLPIPGLQSIIGIVNAIVRAATTYIDETIFSYNLARGDEQRLAQLEGRADLLRAEQQGAPEDGRVGRGARQGADRRRVGRDARAGVPAAGRAAGGSAPAAVIAGLVVAALFASNIRQAFLKPIFLVMVMTKFHVLVRNQPINLEWDQRLSSVSRKFGEIKEKAAAGWNPPAQAPAGTLPPA